MDAFPCIPASGDVQVIIPLLAGAAHQFAWTGSRRRGERATPLAGLTLDNFR